MIFLNRKYFFKKNVLDAEIKIVISNSMVLNNFFLCCLDFWKKKFAFKVCILIFFHFDFFSFPSVIIIKIQKMGPKMIFLNRKFFFKKNVLDSQIEILISNSMFLNNFFLCCLTFEKKSSQRLFSFWLFILTFFHFDFLLEFFGYVY